MFCFSIVVCFGAISALLLIVGIGRGKILARIANTSSKTTAEARTILRDFISSDLSNIAFLHGPTFFV